MDLARRARAAKSTQPLAAAMEPPEVRMLQPYQSVLHTKHYRILEPLGEGGMGWVYRAWDPVLERDLALKVLKPGVPGRARERFRHEALFGARLCHPGIARVFDLGILPDVGLDWFSMEYLRGRDFERLLGSASRKGLRLPLRLVGLVFDRVLDALAHAHDRGVVHRDFKPSNVFVTRESRSRRLGVKLLDFGVAIDMDVKASHAEICGDPRYVAPEQADGARDLDGRADLYAAGISLFEAATGEHPFADLLQSPAEELLAAQRDRPLPHASHVLSGGISRHVALALDAVLDKACAKDPEYRFQSATDMREALADALRSDPIY